MEKKYKIKKVKVGSSVTIKYVDSNVVQSGNKIISKEDANTVRTNKKIWLELDSNNKKKEFEKNNKMRFDFGEITEDSPLGKAIMGLEIGETGTMILPQIQGGENQIEVINIE